MMVDSLINNYSGCERGFAVRQLRGTGVSPVRVDCIAGETPMSRVPRLFFEQWSRAISNLKFRISNFRFAIVFLFFLTGCSHSPPQLRTGEAALEQHNFSAAISAADTVIASDVSSNDKARAFYLRGRALEDRPKETGAAAENDLSQAWRNYTAALAEKPSPAFEGYIRTSLGNVAYWLGDFATAEQQWAAAYPLLKEPELRGWVLYRRGLCEQRLGRWAEADTVFAAVKSQYPNSEPASRAAGKAGARAFYVQVGAFDKPASADAVVAQLSSRRFPVAKQQAGALQRVMVGPFAKYADALAAQAKLSGEYRDAMIVP